jgi:hypothetical protein
LKEEEKMKRKRKRKKKKKSEKRSKKFSEKIAAFHPVIKTFLVSLMKISTIDLCQVRIVVIIS